MPSDNLLKYGVLRCRDLVELYFGARMVMALVENNVEADGTIQTIINQDQRRIRYEIVAVNLSAIAPNFFNTGSRLAFANGTPAQYMIPPGATIVITRDFFTDGDAVCIEVQAQAQLSTVGFSTRETFLTPAPVDEVPLG